MNMQEESRETASEVRQEAVRHRSQETLNIIGQILIVVFLYGCYIKLTNISMSSERSTPYSEEHEEDPARTCHHTS